MLREGFQVCREAHRGRWEVIVVQGAGIALGTSFGETGFLLDASLHLELHLRVGAHWGKRVQKLFDVHLLLWREVVGHGKGLRLESGLQTVRLAERPPLIAAAVKLVLDHHRERRGLRLGLFLLLAGRSTGVEAQLGSGRILGLAARLILSVSRAVLVRGVAGRRGRGRSRAGVRLPLDTGVEVAVGAVHGRG